jgi:MAF protein
MSTQQLILASSSPYRKKLLQTITQNFVCASPNIDESKRPEENAVELVERLAIEKAKAVAIAYPKALIIGSDQVCEFICSETQEKKIIGKPRTHENAMNHLREVSGKSVTLKTGLALYDASTQIIQSHVESFSVEFRELNDNLINKYLLADQPYNCAGAVKVESKGIILIKKMNGNDPNSLIGLPLIQLVSMLNKQGFPLL